MAIGTRNEIIAGTDIDAAPLDENFLKLWNMFNGGIDSDCLAENSVTNSKIASGAVTTAEIAASAGITGAQLAAATVTNSNLAGDIALDKLAAAVAAKLNPVGKVGYFTQSSAPAGWIEGSGQLALKASYPDLWALWNGTAFYTLVTTAFGADNGTEFRLPDLRGLFIRGSGTNSRTGYTDAIGGAVGAMAQDSLSSHSHTVVTSGNVAAGYGLVASASFTDQPIITVNSAVTSYTESKPNNMALLGCIKY